MTLNQMLYEATMEVLEDLGEEVMQALVWQMGVKGVSFAPDTFEIKEFSVALQELVGDGAESLLEEVYQNALCRLELLRPLAFSDNGGSIMGEGNAVQSPIHKLLTLFGDAPVYDANDESKE